MDPRRLRIGEWLTGLGGVTLLASTFLAWYEVDSRVRSEGDPTPGVPFLKGTHSAWEAFSVLDVFIAVVAVLAIAAAVLAAAHNASAVSLAFASLTAFAGLGVTIAVLVRMLSPPELTISGISVPDIYVGPDTLPDDFVSVAVGAWAGLAAVLGTTVGAFITVRDEGFLPGARIAVPVETIPPPPEGGQA